MNGTIRLRLETANEQTGNRKRSMGGSEEKFQVFLGMFKGSRGEKGVKLNCGRRDRARGGRAHFVEFNDDKLSK